MSSVELKTGLAGMAGDPTVGCRLTLNVPEVPLADGWRSRTLSPRIDGEMPLDVMTQQLRQFCGDFSVVPMAGRRVVHGGMAPTRIGGLDALFIGQDLERVTRDAYCIRQDPGDNYFLIFQDHGKAHICQASFQFQMQPGDVALVDSTRPMDFVFGGHHSQQISLHLPREEMRRRFGPRIESGLGLLRQDALGLAMRAILAKMLEPAHQESSHLKEAFLGVLGSMLLERSSQCMVMRSGGNEALLSAAFQQVSRRFQDPTFNATDLAAALNLSPRSLQRLFQRLGESPSRRILNTRLEAARERLLLQRGAAQVSLIAYDCGFNDLSFFYREFRKKYGVRPGHLVNP